MLCASCGQPQVQEKSNPCSKQNGNPCQPCIQLADLDRRIIEARDALDRVLNERHRLKASVNQCHDPFANIPTELTCKIFQACLPPPPTTENFDESRDEVASIERFGQFTLGSVCRRWRQTIWSVPAFWDVLSFKLNPRTPVRLVEEWLNRSGQSPLALRVWSDPSTGASGADSSEVIPDSLIVSLLEILSPSFSRCIFAHFNLPPANGLVSRIYCDPLQPIQLECLKLGCDISHEYGRRTGYKHRGRFGIGSFPSLRRLSIVGYRIYNVEVEWHNLTHFSGRYLGREEYLEILRRSPNLVEFGIHDDSFLAPTDPTPVMHEALKSLKLNCGGLDLLVLLSAPALEDLQCRFYECGPVSTYLLRFIRTSGCLLTSLALLFPAEGRSSEEVMDILQQTYSLKELTFGFHVEDRFFKRLGETKFRQPGDVTHSFLPNLSTLRFVSEQWIFQWTSLYDMLVLIHPQPSMICRPLCNVVIKLEYWDELGPGTQELEDILEIEKMDGINYCVCTNKQVDLIEIWKEYNSVVA